MSRKAFRLYGGESYAPVTHTHFEQATAVTAAAARAWQPFHCRGGTPAPAQGFTGRRLADGRGARRGRPQRRVVAAFDRSRGVRPGSGRDAAADGRVLARPGAF